MISAVGFPAVFNAIDDDLVRLIVDIVENAIDAHAQAVAEVSF